MTPCSPENLDRAFEILVAAAITGSRCPVTSGPDVHPYLTSAHIVALAKRGHIRSEVSGHNWRQITILTGRHAGKKTAPNPNENAVVYKTMDAKGSKSNTSVQRRVSAGSQGLSR